MKKSRTDVERKNKVIAKEMKEYLHKLKSDHLHQEELVASEKKKRYNKLLKAEKIYYEMKEYQESREISMPPKSISKSVTNISRPNLAPQKSMPNIKKEPKPISLGNVRKKNSKVLKSPKKVGEPISQLQSVPQRLKMRVKSNHELFPHSPNSTKSIFQGSVDQRKSYYEEVVKKNFKPNPSFRKQVELQLINEKLKENTRKRKNITKMQLGAIG